MIRDARQIHFPKEFAQTVHTNIGPMSSRDDVGAGQFRVVLRLEGNGGLQQVRPREFKHRIRFLLQTRCAPSRREVEERPKARDRIMADLRARIGVGVGVRWKSPVGPLQMDLAYGVAVRRFRLHLSVGFAF